MKGRKTNILEHRNTLIDALRRRFPEKAHLFEEYFRHTGMHAESEIWLQFTEHGIAKHFEKFLNPTEIPLGLSQSIADDLSLLASIANRIKWLDQELRSGANPSSMQQHLRTEIIEPINNLDRKWVRGIVQ